MIFIQENYLLWKSLHLVAVVCWMCGLLYLPRLFVYHHQSPLGSMQAQTFKIMEQKLRKIILNPAMILTFVFGVLLILVHGSTIFKEAWFHGKLTALIGLTAFHGFCIRQIKAFYADQYPYSEKFFRIINEIPVLLMTIIIFLVVFKPFSG